MSMTEKELGRYFEKIIERHPLNDFKFDMLFEEVESYQGIPDYVGIKIEDEKQWSDFYARIPLERWNEISKILAVLSGKSYHTVEYLLKKTGMSKASINKELGYLLKLEIVDRNDNGLYKINDWADMPSVKISSFELKLENWKRALFQALRYKMFSDYTYVVMPVEKRDILEKNKKVFSENNVGIVLYDHLKRKLEIMNRPRKNTMISPIHYWYMVGRLMHEIDNNKQVSSKVQITY